MAFMLSASYHAVCRQGSLTLGKRRGEGEEVLHQLGSDTINEGMTLEQLRFRKDECDQLLLTLLFIRENQDAINKVYRRPFQFTPLEEGSPYDTAKLAFLFLTVHGAFKLPPMEAFDKGDFTLKDEAKSWPLFSHVDQSSGTIKNQTPKRELTSNFRQLVMRAGFDVRRVTHHCNRAGMATTFIINEVIAHNGIFPRESVATLCRLAGWSEEGGTWALYIKEVFEKHLDGNAYLYRNLRSQEDKSYYLRRVHSNYNYRLIAPEKNLISKDDCDSIPDFSEFYKLYKDRTLQCTIKEATEVLKEWKGPDGIVNGMTRAQYERRLACVRRRAVDSFAASYNIKLHDRQWSRSEPPNPSKEAFLKN